MSLPVAVATGFYLSYIPVKLFRGLRLPRHWSGAGFVGTLLGWAGLGLLPRSAGAELGALTAAIGAGVWVCGAAEREFKTHDDPRIVLDEVVGYWTAMAMLPRSLWWAAAGFVIFRIFDSMKLPILKRLERLPGGWGIMLDDVGAGIATNLILRIMSSTGVFA